MQGMQADVVQVELQRFLNRHDASGRDEDLPLSKQQQHTAGVHAMNAGRRARMQQHSHQLRLAWQKQQAALLGTPLSPALFTQKLLGGESNQPGVLTSLAQQPGLSVVSVGPLQPMVTGGKAASPASPNRLGDSLPEASAVDPLLPLGTIQGKGQGHGMPQSADSPGVHTHGWQVTALPMPPLALGPQGAYHIFQPSLSLSLGQTTTISQTSSITLGMHLLTAYNLLCFRL